MNALGTVSIYGVTGQMIFWGYSFGGGNIVTRDVLFTDNVDVDPLWSKYGDLVNMKTTNYRGSCVMSYIPVGSSLLNCKAASYIPPIWSVVVLSGFTNQLDGYWNYSGGGTHRQINNSKNLVTLPLLRVQKLPAQILANTMVQV